jgi:hypothetical protein
VKVEAGGQRWGAADPQVTVVAQSASRHLLVRTTAGLYHHSRKRAKVVAERLSSAGGGSRGGPPERGQSASPEPAAAEPTERSRTAGGEGCWQQGVTDRLPLPLQWTPGKGPTSGT